MSEPVVLNRDNLRKELKGTLAYIAPEQTGRVNHSADHRADLYSLGVTLYQLAYGKTPFSHYSDPAQIIYAHIAEPAPAIDKTEIPRAFGLVLSKLLEKNPKSRYQSGISLLKDLEDIAASLKSGEEPLNFTAAAEDFDSRIVIAEGVFGREREITSLKQAYENSAKKASILCLNGPSGIGKSAICRELFSTISQTNSFYLAGKYDQFSKGQAYTAISAALTQFVKQAQSDETNNWAKLLQDCIANEAALLTSIVPRFCELLGEQDEIPIMSVKEIKTRRNLLFEKLILQICKTLVHQNRHLVLLIDDLQWADTVSIEILERLCQQAPAGLMLILSFRDEEIVNNEKANQLYQAISKQEKQAKAITLGPLGIEEISNWMKLQFSLNKEDNLRLAEQLLIRTDGNPFHIRTLLNKVIEDDIIYQKQGKTHCEWTRLEALQSASADEFVEEKLEKLEKIQFRLISEASVLGSSFSFDKLYILFDLYKPETEVALRALVKQQLLIKTGEMLMFSHDKVQAISAKQLSAKKREELNWKVGAKLLEQLGSDNNWQALSDCLLHCNEAIALIRQAETRKQLSRLNYRYAKHLMQQAAYQQAELNLLAAQKLLYNVKEQTTSIKELPPYSEQAAEIHISLGQILCNTGRGERGEKLFDWVLQHAQSRQDRIPAHVAKLVYLSSVYRIREARKELALLLNALGIKIPARIKPWHLLGNYSRTMLNSKAWQPEKIAQMPEMTDPAAQKTMNALSSCLLAAFMAATDYDPIILSHMVRLALKHGTSRHLARALIGFGVFHMAFNNYGLAKRYADSALSLLDRFENRSTESYVNIAYGCLIHHWHGPVKECEIYLNRGFETAMAMGDIETANITVNVIMGQNYLSGINLELIRQKYARLTDLVSLNNSGLDFQLNNMGRQFNHTLSHPDSDGLAIVGKYFNEAQINSFQKKKGDNLYVSAFFADKAYLHIMHGQYSKAFEFAARAFSGPLAKSIGSYYWGMLYFTLAYSALECLNHEKHAKRANKLYRIAKKKINAFAKQSPASYEVKRQIILSREIELKGNFKRSLEQYHRAISVANKLGNSPENAMLKELYGRFLLSSDYRELAPAQIMEAAQHYQKWGALPKLRELQNEFDYLKQEHSYNNQSSLSSSKDLATEIDFQCLSQSIEVLSSTLDEQSLISGLMRALIVNSGASKAVYLSFHNEQLSVRAVQIGQAQCEHFYGRDALLANFELRTEAINRFFSEQQEQLLCNYKDGPKDSSLLILPVLRQEQIRGLLYLENNLMSNAFRAEHIKVLRLLAGQAAIALENAKAFVALDEERKHNATLIRSMPMMIFALGADATIKYVNPEAIRVSQYSREELIGLNWWDSLYVGSDEELRRKQGRMVIYGEMENYEYPIFTKSGEERIILWTSVVKKNSESERQIMLFGLDATEEIHAKRKILNFNEELQSKVEERTLELEDSLINLKATQNKLIESEKNAALNSLVAGVAHEINTPIGIGVTGISQLQESTKDIIKSYKTGSMTQDQLESYFDASDHLADLTHNNLRRAAELVRNFKQISVDQASEAKRRFKVKSYFEQLIQSLQTQIANKSISIELNIENDFEINSFPGLYAQIVTNLVMNSLHHAFKDVDQGKITIETRLNEQTVEIEYRDNGVGIAEEHLQKIFDPFFTTNSQGGGSGLGLNIVYNIVTQTLEGELDCNSKLGEGVCFSIKLPKDL